MAATCSSSACISAKVKPWASKRSIACSRVNFCGIGSGMSGGETFRTIGMLHLLRGLYRTPVIMQQRRKRAEAQQAHAVDAASRPQDPSFFEGRYQSERFPDLSVAAQLMGRPLGG